MTSLIAKRELKDLAQRMSMHAFDAFARVIDDSIDSTDNRHLHYLAVWDERHALAEFEVKAMALLRCLGDRSFSRRDSVRPIRPMHASRAEVSH